MYFWPFLSQRNTAARTEVTVRTLKLKTHLCKPMGMLASKYRQSVASIDLLLQIFYAVLMLWACPFLGERHVGEEREERGTEGSTSGLESGVLTQ